MPVLDQRGHEYEVEITTYRGINQINFRDRIWGYTFTEAEEIAKIKYGDDAKVDFRKQIS